MDVKCLGFLIVLVLGCAVNAFSDSTPSPVVQTGSGTWDVGLISDGSGLWSVASPNTVYTSGDSSIIIHQLTLNSDPNIFDFFGLTNTGSTPATYNVTVPLTVSLPAGEYAVASTISGSVTDGTSNGVTLSPLPGEYILQVMVGSLDSGVDLLNQPMTFNLSPGNSQVIGPVNANGTLDLTDPLTTTVNVTTDFTLSAGASAAFTYDFSVNLEASAAPEPSSSELLLMAAAMLFLVLRWRRWTS